MGTWITEFLDTVLSLLPRSPFIGVFLDIEQSDWIGWLNWIFPIGDILTILAAWLIAIALYYAYSVIARWIKVIS